MKRAISILLVLILVFAGSAAAYAVEPNVIFEQYSADGYYTDNVGNAETYSFHVPQIFAESPVVDAINAEIRANFGKRVEAQFQNMDGGFSLWSWHTEWHAYWNGKQLFLLVTADENGGFHDYGVYGYDFETDSRITKEMILAQRGIREVYYQENLREKTRLMFEDLYAGALQANGEASAFYNAQLEKTISDENLEDAVLFINQFGDLEAVTRIYSLAGAEWYYHLVTPFAYG